MKILEQAQEELEKHYELLDRIVDQCDRKFSDTLEEFEKQQPKLKKKERKAALMLILAEKMPNFSKLLEEFDNLTEAIGIRIEASQAKLQEKLDTLGDIESLQEEIEDKKRELEL